MRITVSGGLHEPEPSLSLKAAVSMTGCPTGEPRLFAYFPH
jgi:hypothetical protein